MEHPNLNALLQEMSVEEAEKICKDCKFCKSNLELARFTGLRVLVTKEKHNIIGVVARVPEGGQD